MSCVAFWTVRIYMENFKHPGIFTDASNLTPRTKRVVHEREAVRGPRAYEPWADLSRQWISRPHFPAGPHRRASGFRQPVRGLRRTVRDRRGRRRSEALGVVSPLRGSSRSRKSSISSALLAWARRSFLLARQVRDALVDRRVPVAIAGGVDQAADEPKRAGDLMGG